MPAAQDWKMLPWQIIQKLYQEHRSPNINSTKWEHEVHDYFWHKMGEPDEWPNTFPSLNDTPTHDLVDGQIVRFR